MAFERVDQDDPTLAVDGLSDLFPAEKAPVDASLALTNVENLFEERDAEDADDCLSGYFDGDQAPVMAAPGEEPAETPVDDDDVLELKQIFESVHGSGSDQVFQSDTQRAALEFQRFAEKFHAFASECAQR